MVSNLVKRDWCDKQIERAAIGLRIFRVLRLLLLLEPAMVGGLVKTFVAHRRMVRNRDKCPRVTRWINVVALSRRTRSCLCFRCASAFLSRSRLLFPPARRLFPERLTSLRPLRKSPSNMVNGQTNTERINESIYQLFANEGLASLIIRNALWSN